MKTRKPYANGSNPKEIDALLDHWEKTAKEHDKNLAKLEAERIAAGPDAIDRFDLAAYQDHVRKWK